MIFDEIYLQKCEEFFGGETLGVDERGEIFKGMLSLCLWGWRLILISSLIVSQKEKWTDILPWTTWMRSSWIRFQHSWLRQWQPHYSNVSAYMKLFSHYEIDSSDLHITFNSKRIYLFYDSVHLMKSIRNNLHNHKGLLFPPYDFEEFDDGICVPAGEIRWQIFCHIHEEDKKLDAHLRAAPKIIASVIPPLEVVSRVSLRP